MVTKWQPTVALAAALIMAGTSILHADAPPTPDDILYIDPDAQSSATITQVFPNSNTSQMILTNVRSIRARQDILIINWGATATTLLPRQYVMSLTVNKRTPPHPATAPAGG